MSLKSLPVHIKEEILLNLPYDSVSFISSKSFWVKKTRRDLGIKRGNKKIYCTLMYIDELEYQPAEFDNLITLIKENNVDITVKLMMELTRVTFANMDSEDDRDMIKRLTDVALAYEKLGNGKYRDALLSGLIRSEIDLFTPDEDEDYEYSCYWYFFEPMKDLFYYMGNEEHILTSSLLSKICIKALGITKRNYSELWTNVIGYLVDWLKTRHPEINFVEDDMSSLVYKVYKESMKRAFMD
jgi:hypothetical protein